MKEKKFVIIIVNSIPPYCFELNNILSLPDGFSYRFRYQKKKQGNWMPEIDNPSELNNCYGLIVLRDFQDTGDFIPIREIFIYKIIIIGDIVYIEYILCKKIELSSNLMRRSEQLESFKLRMEKDINIIKYPNTPKKDLKNLIFFGSDYTFDINDEFYKGKAVDKDSNKWGNLIETIGKYKSQGIQIYKDTDFLNIIGIEDEEGTRASIIIKKLKAFYEIENNKVYKIVFLQRSYTGKSASGDSSVIVPRIVTLSAGNPEIIPIISQKIIAGKYDLLELTFKTAISTASLKSYIILEVQEHSNNWKKSPPIIIPVKVNISKRQLLYKIISIFIFIVLFLVYSYSYEIILFLNQPNTLNEIINPQVVSLRNILLPLMIIFGSNTFVNITHIKEFIFGRINI
ncbi:MAG: hypothetical protein EHM58_15230 [Ignavibacteriae bacterium]|nr:MAG: hypothetical protein EHM58_15230 [Ignavibacteriota bacterium]